MGARLGKCQVLQRCLPPRKKPLTISDAAARNPIERLVRANTWRTVGCTLRGFCLSA
jgi:hypothetical protein